MAWGCRIRPCRFRMHDSCCADGCQYTNPIKPALPRVSVTHWLHTLYIVCAERPSTSVSHHRFAREDALRLEQPSRCRPTPIITEMDEDESAFPCAPDTIRDANDAHDFEWRLRCVARFPPTETTHDRSSLASSTAPPLGSPIQPVRARHQRLGAD